MSNKFSLLTVLEQDAEAIEAVRNETKSLHQSGNIKAAGNQFEQFFRDLLVRKFPPRYRITHGHIAFLSGKISPQIDVLIVDALNTPSIFKAEDGTEYVPYNSVYAIGEVKTNYYNSKSPIEDFSQKLEKIEDMDGSKSEDRTPLFSFVFFGNSNDLNSENVLNYFNNRDFQYLPNITCWLDYGTLLYYQFFEGKEGDLHPRSYMLWPHEQQLNDDEYFWGIAEGEFSVGKSPRANLSRFLGVLWQHLHYSKLTHATLGWYLSTLMMPSGVRIST